MSSQSHHPHRQASPLAEISTSPVSVAVSAPAFVGGASAPSSTESAVAETLGPEGPPTGQRERRQPHAVSLLLTSNLSHGRVGRTAPQRRTPTPDASRPERLARRLLFAPPGARIRMKHSRGAMQRSADRRYRCPFTTTMMPFASMHFPDRIASARAIVHRTPRHSARRYTLSTTSRMWIDSINRDVFRSVTRFSSGPVSRAHDRPAVPRRIGNRKAPS